MIQTYLKRMPELAISGAMILIMLLFSLIFNLPIIYPSGERRSEEHTSELQSLMRISYAVFCLKKQTTKPPVLLSTQRRTRTHRFKPQCHPPVLDYATDG